MRPFGERLCQPGTHRILQDVSGNGQSRFIIPQNPLVISLRLAVLNPRERYDAALAAALKAICPKAVDVSGLLPSE